MTLLALAPWYRPLVLFVVLVGLSVAVVLAVAFVYFSIVERVEARRDPRPGYVYDRDNERLPL